MICHFFWSSNMAAVRLLLERGVNYNTCCAGNCLISLAAMKAPPDVVRKLIDGGAKLDVKDIYGDFPIHTAVRRKDARASEVVDLLLRAGSDINHLSGSDHSTPLHRLVAFNPENLDLAAHLLARGADPMVENKFGNTTIDFANGMFADTGQQMYKDLAVLLGNPRQQVAMAASEPAKEKLVSLPPSPVMVPRFQNAVSSDVAILVGIESYAELPGAVHAEKDAASARKFFRALGLADRNIFSLSGAKATRTGLEKVVEAWLPNNLSAGQRVYFYFSGHGAPDPKSGDAYLVPYDGDPQYLAQTGYPLKRLYQSLDKLKAKQVVVMLDSCFSGTGGRSVLAKGTRPLVGKVETAPPVAKAAGGGSRLLVITASGPDQISGADEAAGYGLFTKHLFDGLNGAAMDAQGRVTVASLYSYLKPKVQDEARRANREQTPQLMGEGAESVILREK